MKCTNTLTIDSVIKASGLYWMANIEEMTKRGEPKNIAWETLICNNGRKERSERP